MDFHEINFSSNHHYHFSAFCLPRVATVSHSSAGGRPSHLFSHEGSDEFRPTHPLQPQRPSAPSPYLLPVRYGLLKVPDPQKLHQRVILRPPPLRHIFWTTPPPGPYLIPVSGSIVKEFITKYVNYIGPKQCRIYRPRGEHPASP